MRTKICIALFPFFVLAGCGTESEADKETEKSGEVYIELLSEPRFFEKTNQECANDSSAACTAVTITYPEFSGTLNQDTEKLVNEKVQGLLIDNMLYDSLSYPSFEAFADAFIDDYEAVRSDFPEAFGWQYDGNVSILRNDSTILTLESDIYLYTGGAHGMRMVKFLNLDSRTGRVYSAEDIFSEGLNDQLNQRIRQAFIRYKGLSEEELADQGYTFENNQYVTENFGLKKDTILFYYNQYNVAPYSAGPTRLAIPLDSIQNLLRPKFR